MTKTEIYQKLTNIFMDVLDDDTIVLDENTTSNDVDGWDSFAHINIIAAIENDFSIKVPVSKTLAMKNVGEMVDFIMTSIGK